MATTIVDARKSLAARVASDAFKTAALAVVAEAGFAIADYTVENVNRPHKALESMVTAGVEIVVFPLTDSLTLENRAGSVDTGYEVAIAIRQTTGDDLTKQDALLILSEAVAVALVGKKFPDHQDAESRWWVTESRTVALFDVNEIKDKGLFIAVRSFSMQ